MNEPIETLLFDFGGTLDGNGVAWKERFYAYYRAEGLDMTLDAFESSFFAADSPLVGNLAPATDLAGTVHALVANLETELARHSATADKTGIANARSNGDAGFVGSGRMAGELGFEVGNQCMHRSREVGCRREISNERRIGREETGLKSIQGH